MFLGLKMPCYLLDACYCVCVCESRIQVFKWFLIELRYRTQWWEANLRVGRSWVPNTFPRAYLNSEPKLERTLYSWFLDHITRWQLHLIFPSFVPTHPKKKKKSIQEDSHIHHTNLIVHALKIEDLCTMYSLETLLFYFQCHKLYNVQSTN